MKPFRPTTHPPQLIVTALILTSILSLGAGLTLIQAAAANSVESPQNTATLKQSRSNELPRSVVNAIRRNLARSTRIPPGQLRVVSFSQQSWPNSCLGLGKPDEACAEIFIENGWRVVMSDGRQNWVYRTDNTGRIVRLEGQETPSSNKLPSSVTNAVLEAASRQLGVTSSQLNITQSQQQTWPDGCLGIPNPVELCLSALTPGWQVTVEGKQQRLVYRTNESGSQVRLDERSSSMAEANLPGTVAKAVLQAASVRTGLPISEFRIIRSEQMTTDGCLSLPRPGEACTRIAISAWEVTLEGGRERLVYRSNSDGSLLRFNEAVSSISDANLPNSVSRTTLQAASQRTGLRVSELRIVKIEPIQTNGCLNLPRPGEGCTKINMPAWELTVEAGQQRLVYRSNADGSQVRFNEAASSIGNTNLPNSVANAVLQLASSHFSLPASQLRIARVEPQNWSDGCLGLPSPVERCMGVLTPGFRVTVEGKGQSQIYRTDKSGSQIRTEAIANLPPRTDRLPNSIAIPILQDVQVGANLPVSQLYILRAEQQEWPDGCLGLAEPGVACTQAIIPGWRVTVNAAERSFIYRTNESGSLITLENDVTIWAPSGAVRIPPRELPPPLAGNALFRAITSGGIAGQTYETTLLNNGQLIRQIITPPNVTTGSMPDITNVDREQLRQFRQMLAQQPWEQFNGWSYLPPTGAADYFTVTLTSRKGTVRYVDISQDSLPEALQDVIRAWNQIAGGR